MDLRRAELAIFPGPLNVPKVKSKDLHLAELLDFRPDQGVIRLHEQRVVILSAAAMGLLRNELIDTLEVPRPPFLPHCLARVLQNRMVG